MTEEEFEKRLDKYANTSGHKKFKNYIREIFESDYFQDFVKKIRTKYKIPKEGFISEDGHYYFPPYEWKLKDDTEKTSAFDEEIEKVCTKYKIYSLDGMGIFKNYIFYNKTDYSIDLGGYGMCMTLEISEELDLISEQAEKYKEAEYPIAILISPYASLRDILDYIKTIYNSDISFLQKKYKDKDIKLGKFKKRKTIIQERNEFIYQNRELPRQEIMKLITNKFGSKNTIDYGYIGKIISLEKKKRKEL